MIKTKLKTASKKLVALFMSILTVICCFASVPITAQAETYDVLNAKDIITEACNFLGADYSFGAKGYTNPYGASDGSAHQNGGGSKVSNQYSAGIDCSGLVYATLSNLGIWTSGFSYNNPVPVDCAHWMYTDYNRTEEVDKTTKVTFYRKDGKETKSKTVKPLYTERKLIVKKNGKWVQKNSYYTSKVNPGSIIITYDPNDPDNTKNQHAWIYIGEADSASALKKMLKDTYGIDVASKYIHDTGNGSTHWRIEATTSESATGHDGGGVYIDNAESGKTAHAVTATLINTTEQTPKKGQIRVKKKVDDSGNAIEGVTFNVYNASTGKLVDTFETNAKGKGVSDELAAGTYNVYEVVPDGYTGSVTSALNVKVEEDKTTDISNNDAGTWINYPQRGDIKITKVNESGSAMSGVTFRLVSSDENNPVDISTTTNASGEAYFVNLKQGEYELIETVPDGYIPSGFTDNGDGTASMWINLTVWDNQSSYAVTNQANNTGDYFDSGASYYFGVTNIVKRGDLKIQKIEETAGADYKGGVYQNGNGFTYTVTSAAANNALGTDLSFTVSTGSDGCAYLCDLPIGTYTVSEINVPSKFVQPDSQTVYVGWDGSYSYGVSGANYSANSGDFNSGTGVTTTFYNYLKMFRVTVEKEDSETEKRARKASS